MRHDQLTEGEGTTEMEVDHFNPHLAARFKNRYQNLFLACGHCNGKKSDWPTKAEIRAGIRFLNPCNEIDYGVHIFENPITHHLEPVTAIGRYHVDMMDLNAPTFVNERKKRAKILSLANSRQIADLPQEWTDVLELIRETNEYVQRLIPQIPPRPEGVEEWI